MTEDKKIPKLLIEARKIMGGKLLDQYDMEIDAPKKIINPYADHPWFKK